MNDRNRPRSICWRSLSRVALHDASLPDDLVEWLWTQPESLVSAGEPLQSKGVRKTVRLEWNAQSYVLKHYVEPSRRHAFKQLAMTSRARQTWNVTHRMADSGILTPRPVACVENRWGPLRRDSFLMYRYVEGDTLRTSLVNEALGFGGPTDELWQQLHALWQRLAKLRASLSDTNTGNFIVCPDGRLWVIDLDKACFYRRASVAKRHRQRAWKQLINSARVSVEWAATWEREPRRKAA